MNISKVFSAAIIIMVLLSATSNAQWSFDTAVSAGTNPTAIAITSDGSKLVVTNNAIPGNVKIISTSDYSISDIDISGIENYPNAVAIAPNDSIAIVNTLHKTIFINLYTHTIKNTITAPCASTTLYGIAITPDGKTGVYPDLSSDCMQQGIRLVDASGNSSNSTFIQVNTTGELYGIALTPDGSSALLTTFSSDSPKIVNLSSSGVQNISGISAGSYGVAMFHNSNEALIFDGDSLDRVSLTTNSKTKTISYLSYNTNFQNIAITKDDKYAFVAGAIEKLVISLDNNSVIETFTAGGTNITTNSNGSEFYVTDSYNGTVRVYKEQIPNGVKSGKNYLPSDYQLSQNYPNPFNPNTTIKYAIPKAGLVTIKVYNILGNEIATLVNEEKRPGEYSVIFNGLNLSSGIYFYRITSGKFTETKKLILMK